MEYNKLIFEISKEGKKGYSLPTLQIKGKTKDILDEKYLRKSNVNLPNVSEVEVVRHYTLLSNKNYGLDAGFYPLGSCTMKYNPKINEDIASLTGFASVHPLQAENTVQGSLELLYSLQDAFKEITGMDYISLQPAAGSQGELTGLMIIKAYHEKNNSKNKNEIIIPDSAHGTNPASATMTGVKAVEIKSNSNGTIDIELLKKVVGENTAGLMLTNPNTLGIFEKDIKEIAEIIHTAGGLLYYDGANMNANMGIARPKEMGFDIVHLNTHKTFSTPHGGGGPGSGPIGVVSELKDFLPKPIVEKKDNEYTFNYDIKNSIGRVKSFYGNFLVLVRAYTYILTLGAEGLKQASEIAVLNANYLKELLTEDYKIFINSVCKHEFVLEGLKESNENIHTVDVAKRIIDYGYHPPTIYFPLIVNEALMIEPNETESKETLDEFARVMKIIAKEAIENYKLLKEAPHNTPVRRLDEVEAARNTILKYD